MPLTHSENEKIIQNNIDDLSFQKRIDLYINGQLKVFETISLGKFNLLKAVGAKTDELTVNQNVIRNSILPEHSRTAHHTSGHNITIDEIKNFTEFIRNPILVMRGNHPNTITLITEIKNQDNQNIIVPIALDLRSTDSIVNKISSIYGKNNIENYLNKKLDKIIAYDK